MATSSVEQLFAPLGRPTPAPGAAPAAAPATAPTQSAGGTPETAAPQQPPAPMNIQRGLEGAAKDTANFALNLPVEAIKSLDPRHIYRNVQAVINPLYGEQGLWGAPYEVGSEGGAKMIEQTNTANAKLAALIAMMETDGKLPPAKARELLNKLPTPPTPAGNESALAAGLHGAAAGAGAATYAGIINDFVSSPLAQRLMNQLNGPDDVDRLVSHVLDENKQMLAQAGESKVNLINESAGGTEAPQTAIEDQAQQARALADSQRATAAAGGYSPHSPDWHGPDEFLGPGAMSRYEHLPNDYEAVAKAAESEGNSELAQTIRDEAAQKFSDIPPGSDKADKMAADILSKGGTTVDLKTGEPVTNGIAVAPYPELSKVVPASELDGKAISEYVKANQKLLSEPNHALGGWYDTSSGNVYLDVSTTVDSQEAAKELGKQFNQKAVFDLGAGKEIDTGGSGEAGAELPPMESRSKIIQDAIKKYGGGGGLTSAAIPATMARPKTAKKKAKN